MASHLIHRNLLLLPSSSCFFTTFSKPLFVSSSITTAPTLSNSPLKSNAHANCTPRHSLLFHSLAHSASVSLPHSLSASHTSEDDDEEEEEVEIDASGDEASEIELGSEDLELVETVSDASETGVAVESSSPLNVSAGEPPKLTVKEKKDLASYAHSLGKKLKSQLVGKSGVTPGLATSFIETLEANELLKIKIHRTCPGELEDVAKQFEEQTGSVIVSQIGRTIILFRPSLSKLKALEKKNENRRIIMRRAQERKSSLLNKELAP